MIRRHQTWSNRAQSGDATPGGVRGRLYKTVALEIGSPRTRPPAPDPTRTSVYADEYYTSRFQKVSDAVECRRGTRVFRRARTRGTGASYFENRNRNHIIQHRCDRRFGGVAANRRAGETVRVRATTTSIRSGTRWRRPRRDVRERHVVVVAVDPTGSDREIVAEQQRGSKNTAALNASCAFVAIHRRAIACDEITRRVRGFCKQVLSEILYTPSAGPLFANRTEQSTRLFVFPRFLRK